MKKSALLFCIVLCLSLLFAGCNTNSPANNSQSENTNPTASQITDSLESQIDYENAVTINFESTDLPEAGVTVNDNVYSIIKGGTYIVSGTLNSGQLYVNADKQDVWLVLDNTHITCENSSALYIADAKNTYIVLKAGSENSLTDGSTYNVSADADPDATLFCKNDLIIGGEGALSINSNYNNALHTKDTLTIDSGNVTIYSVDTGIKAKDGFEMTNGVLSVTSYGDGLQTTNSEDTDKGNILISGGEITITAQKDAIQSENDLTISGGSFNIKTGGGAENADYKYDNPMGFWQGYEDNSSDVSMKAIKAQGNLNISNGNFLIDSEDDALHSNNDVNISGGSFSIASGDDGIHADSVTTISGGEIDISQSYEGIEGSEVNIDGGTIHLRAFDDGVNSAGGGDTEYSGFGRDSFNSSSTYRISVTGGYIYVNADGDGFDSNGNMDFSGGTTIINGPESNGNSPLDWDRECTISGGTVIAAGSSGMMERISSDSTQCNIAVYFDSTYSADTLCNISDNNSFSLSFAPAKSFSYLLVSSPMLKEGTEYSIYTNCTHSGNQQDGVYTDGTCTQGDLFDTVLLESTVTSAGTASGFRGPGGGMPPGDHRW